MRIERVYGVDFSGARLAGRNAWVAQLDTAAMRIDAVDRLGALCGTDEREPCMMSLVSMIKASRRALWGMDFPFALPIEIAATMTGLADQLAWVQRQAEDAYAFGRQCVAIARALGREMHVRRLTDRETKTPFDCYHYRIICQTFYGMRNVLAPLHASAGTIIVPFDAVSEAQRVVVEACPGSTLKRWGVPHNNYKQPAGGPLTPKRRTNRRLILERLRSVVTIDDRWVRIIQRNPGGDALDAVIAAVGTWEAWRTTDFSAVRAHPRYRLEGRVFA